MNSDKKRHPTRWDTSAKRLSKRMPPRAKRAIFLEYEERTAEGEPRASILEDLAARHEKSTRQIERYIHDAGQAQGQADEEKMLSRAKRLVARLDRTRTVHERALQEMAKRLPEEVALPPSHHVFIVSRDNQYWYPHQLSWLLSEEGKVRVFLRLEHDEETRLPYGSLMEHLSAPGFSSVAPDIAQWKKRAADYLKTCYAFVSHVAEEVEAVLGTDVTVEYAGQPAMLVFFPLTVCFDAVDRARGTALTAPFTYKTESLGGNLTQLRFGAYAIAVAKSPAEADHLQREHYDLRNKHANSQHARTAAAIAQEATDLETRIGDKLRRFSLTTPVPGQCSLCRPPAE